MNCNRAEAVTVYLKNYGAPYQQIPTEPEMPPQAKGSHCHNKFRTANEVDRRARRKLIMASVLCLAFTIGEVVGGALAGSLAIMTDASHMMTDFASFMISLFALYISSRPATKKMSFGWYRAEVMGAVVSVLMIWIVTGVLVYLAIQRCIHEDYDIDAKVMLITAGVGVAVNLILGLTLGGHGHSHGGMSHSHSSTESLSHVHTNHSHSINDGDSESDLSNSPVEYRSQHSHTHDENINVRAAFIHVLGDLLQSIGVLIASYIIYFKPEWKIADPICTFLFSVLVLFTTISVMKDAVYVLMEATPRNIDFKAVKQSFLEIPGAREVHNLRIWSLTTSKLALAVHIAIDLKQTDYETVLRQSSLLIQQMGIQEPTVQVEAYQDDMDDCSQCQDPDSD
ncbi:zinc transporter 2 isoform X2 [Lingula anatina]|uniref:Zinc transporter 2 isoform X2 n=1 Tax=Lingula anatina TaxID=7574 RepID=A0A1S3I6C9_LINAN|nr:zinc transporter 2 isoform X2 [Lingula anatina]|eukprot:XP_013393812.1 zinc transporter 2 isoform X2 [Lingula anatina]